MTTHTPSTGLADRRSPAAADSSGWMGRQVRLREIDATDHRTLIGFDRDSARGHPVQAGEYRHWAAHRGGSDSGDSFQFAIESLHGRTLVGSMSITRSDPFADRFSYGIGIAPQHRRCGYAGDAITTLLAFMFRQHGYRKCETSIYGGNLASLTLHGVLGFREETRRRDTELSHGNIKYLVLMSITAGEFAALHPDFAAGAPVRPRRGRHWRPHRGQHWPS